MIDLLWRCLYRAAYRVMRVYWAVAHPETHGALVAVWHGGELLLVRNSYTPYRGLPGGYVRRGEAARDAAARELREEVGLRVAPSDLRPAMDLRHEWDGKRDHVEIFELEAAQRPALAIDRREVIEAAFWPPERALALRLFPPIREIIARRGANAARPTLTPALSRPAGEGEGRG